MKELDMVFVAALRVGVGGSAVRTRFVVGTDGEEIVKGTVAVRQINAANLRRKNIISSSP